MRSKKNRSGPIVALLLTVLLTSGCGWMPSPFFDEKSMTNPGTIAKQQHYAVKFDPYPSNILGPPIDGARPRAYLNPPDEVSDVQQNLPWGNWRGYP